MADGYGASLFDESGPKNFATAVGGISTALTGVGTAFTTFGKTASDTLTSISSTVDKLLSKLSQVQSSLSSVSTAATSAGGGGPQSVSNIPSPTQGGPQPGNQWTTGNAPQPNAGTGSAPGLSGMPQGTAANPNGFWSRLFGWVPEGSASAAGAPYGGVMAGGGGGAPGGGALVGGGGGGGVTGMSQGTANTGGLTMLQRGMQSMIPAGIGAVTNFAQGLTPTAVQGQAIGAMYGQGFGVTQRSLYQQPYGVLSNNPADYAQTAAYLIQNTAAGPGSQNWSTLMGPTGGIQQFAALMPGATMQQRAATVGSMYNPTSLNAGLAFGFNFQPGGTMENPQQQFATVFQRLTDRVGGKPTAQQVQAWMGPGGPWMVNLQALGWDDSTIAAFRNYALDQAQANRQGKTLSQVEAGGIKSSAYWAGLQQQSAKSRMQQQAEPALAQVSKWTSQVTGAAYSFLNPVAQFLGGGGTGGAGAGGMLGGILGVGGGGLASLLGGGGGGLLGGLGGLLGGGGGLLGGLLKGGGGLLGAGGGLLGGLTHLGGGLLGSIGGLGSHLGGFLGGLFGGTPAGAAEPKKKSSSATTANVTQDDLATVLTSKAPTNSLLHILTQPVPKGQNTLASALIGSSSGAGGTGAGAGVSGMAGGGSGGGVGGGAGAWNYKGSMTTAMDLSGIFSSTSSSSTTTGSGSSSSPGSTGSIPSTGTLTDAQVQQLWIQAGGPQNVAATMSGIAQAESGRQPSNVQKGEPANLTGWGLWQITPTSGISQNGKFGNLLDPLNNAKAALSLYKAAGNTLQPWAGDPYVASHGGGTSSGVGYARGSQLIARTQLAMLHQGEAVVPAADNYSTNPYNKNGAVNNAAAAPISLNFKAGSVILQVPANATASDMANLAQQFVNAIATPQVISAVRSS
jgi:Lysozyme like domain